jgi:hypothetical protein
MVVDAASLDGLPSLPAPVVPGTVVVPRAVGVPVTVQTIDVPGATVAGVAGVQFAIKPAGNTPTLQDADVAAIAGAPAFEHA